LAHFALPAMSEELETSLIFSCDVTERLEDERSDSRSSKITLSFSQFRQQLVTTREG
jgi:hypothetical protein